MPARPPARPPAPGGSCLSRSPCGMGTGMTCPWKGPRSTRAVHLAFQFEKQGLFYSMAFSSLLPCSRVRMHLQKSQAQAIAVGCPKNDLARSSLSILCTFRFAAHIGFKQEHRARSPGGRLGKSPNVLLSFLPASRRERERGNLVPTDQSETGEGALRVGLRPSRSSRLTLPSLAALSFLYFFLDEHHFTYTQKEEEKTWTNYQTK